VSDDLPPLSVLATWEPIQTWIDYLTGVGEPGSAVTLPTREALPEVLLDLAVPHEDIDAMVAALPDRERTPNAWWLIERCVAAIERTMGRVQSNPPLPTLPNRFGPLARYLPVYGLLGALPLVDRYHESLGVPREVRRATLRDLGRNMAVTRRRTGSGGLVTAFWLVRHLRGVIFQLGRLQFERVPLDSGTRAAMVRAGLAAPDPRASALSVHVPEFSGPLSPSACDRSLDQAREFFARHFPDERFPVVVCDSWLLDEQLAEYLPVESNIVRFQRRFRPIRRPGVNDQDIQLFVFGKVAPAAALPRDTGLQRAIDDHLRAGRHWHGGFGWSPL
jgi:hypothetical protein